MAEKVVAALIVQMTALSLIVTLTSASHLKQVQTNLYLSAAAASIAVS